MRCRYTISLLLHIAVPVYSTTTNPPTRRSRKEGYATIIVHKHCRRSFDTDIKNDDTDDDDDDHDDMMMIMITMMKIAMTRFF